VPDVFGNEWCFQERGPDVFVSPQRITSDDLLFLKTSVTLQEPGHFVYVLEIDNLVQNLQCFTYRFINVTVLHGTFSWHSLMCIITHEFLKAVVKIQSSVKIDSVYGLLNEMHILMTMSHYSRCIWL
jgi:hypothetical protein